MGFVLRTRVQITGRTPGIGQDIQAQLVSVQRAVSWETPEFNPMLESIPKFGF
jgi:hypothetical protein